MDKRIEKLKTFRQYLLAQVADLSPAQLNEIPQGHNNNIIWNMAHLIAAQQSLCYMRAGRAIRVDDRYWSPWLTGTRPGAPLSAEDTDRIKQLYISTMDELQTDLDRHYFDNYTPSPNIQQVYGLSLNSIEDTLEFLLYHEGIHTSSILSLQRLVS